MDRICLDTSVLAKGIIPPRRKKKDSIYEKKHKLHRIAKSFLKKVERKEATMFIPSIAIVEIAAVAARLTGKKKRGIQASDYVKAKGNILYDIQLLEEATKTAAKTSISGFDSIFISCAKITDSTLITDDRKMYEAAVKIELETKFLKDIESIK